MIHIDCTTYHFSDGTCVENGGCNGCPAQYRAKTINLNRDRQAATTSVGRAWIMLVGAVVLIPALGFAALHAADVHHTQILANQESGIVAWKR